MKKYDFRFDMKIIKSFIGGVFKKYKHVDYIYTNSVTGILGFEVDDNVFELINEYEAFDFLNLDDEATIFSISNSNWEKIDSTINNDINENIIKEKIKKVIVVNDHITFQNKETILYDMWDTKAIIFKFDNYEICFAKQDCWFSQEIEIYKGYDLLTKIGDGKEILSDFNEKDSKFINLERAIIEVV